MPNNKITLCKVCNAEIVYNFPQGGKPRQFCNIHMTAVVPARLSKEAREMLEEMTNTEWGKVTAGEFITRLIIKEYESRKK